MAREIKHAFRSRSITLHPDKYRDGHAREACDALSHASAVLGSPIYRYFYDGLCCYVPDGPTE
eukprot:10140239-Alexandrium_andersonii.AAC.1